MLSVATISVNPAGFSSSKQPEGLDVPQSPDKVIPNFPLLARDLISFTRLLTAEDARVMVDLLKLAVARRLGLRGKETLAAVLTAMAKTNTEVHVEWRGRGKEKEREREREKVREKERGGEEEGEGERERE